MTDKSLRDMEEMSQDYEDSLKVYRDLKNVLDTAELKGIKKGLKKGRAEGRAEVAKAMLKNKMDIEQISELTGLSIEEIKQLQV